MYYITNSLYILYKLMSKKVKQALTVLLLAVAGGIFGFFMARFLSDPAEVKQFTAPWYYKVSLLPIMLIAMWLTIAIHELGHLLTGLAVKFRFRLISIGPVMFEREQNTLRFKWNTNFNTYGGVALCLPTNQAQLTRRFALFVAGGPVASLVWGVITLALTLHVNLDRSIYGLYVADFFIFISCFLTFAVALSSLIPMRSGGFYTDGGRLLNLLRGGFKAKVEATLLQYIAYAASGIRPRHQDPAPLHTLIHHTEESPMKVIFHGLLYYQSLDRANLSDAEHHLAEYTKGIDTLPEGYRASLWLENAWFEARFKNNASLARDYYQKDKFGVMIPKSSIYRSEAAIAFAEGNYELAISKAKDALIELPKHMDKGAAIAEKEWLEALIQEAQLQLVFSQQASDPEVSQTS
jgi:hypothetical protein